MKKLIYIFIGLLALYFNACTKDSISTQEQIAGTYVDVNEINSVTTVYRFQYGKMKIEESKSAVLFEDGTLNTTNASIDCLEKFDNNIFAEVQSSNYYEYSYKDGVFSSDYYSGPLYSENGNLTLSGKALKRVYSVNNASANPKSNWIVQVSLQNGNKLELDMTWDKEKKMEGITGWWHFNLPISGNVDIRLIWEGDRTINRGPDPNLPEILQVGKAFSAIQDGNWVSISGGEWDIYLSTDGSKMILF